MLYVNLITDGLDRVHECSMCRVILEMYVHVISEEFHGALLILVICCDSCFIHAHPETQSTSAIKDVLDYWH